MLANLLRRIRNLLWPDTFQGVNLSNLDPKLLKLIKLYIQLGFTLGVLESWCILYYTFEVLDAAVEAQHLHLAEPLRNAVVMHTEASKWVELLTEELHHLQQTGQDTTQVQKALADLTTTTDWLASYLQQRGYQPPPPPQIYPLLIRRIFMALVLVLLGWWWRRYVRQQISKASPKPPCGGGVV